MVGFARMADEQYFAADGLSSSELKQFVVSPAHYANYKKNPPADSPTFIMGRMAHAFILEGKKEWVVIDGDRRTKAIKEKVATAKANGDIVISQKEACDIFGMAESIKRNGIASAITANAECAELAGFVKDPHSGLLLKAKIDYLPSFGPVTWDLKTTAKGGAHLNKFKWTRKDFRYDVQGLHYNYVANLLGVERKEVFMFVAVEKEAPYAVAVHRLNEAFFEKNMPWYLDLLLKFAECKENDDFTECYPEAITDLDW